MTTLRSITLHVANYLIALLLVCASQAAAQPALPPQVQADMLKRSIVAAFAQADNAKVLAEMDKYHALAKEGVPIPGPLLFIESKVASASGQNIRAEAALRKYFEVVDANDPRYQEALDLYPKVQALVEVEAAEKKRQEALVAQRKAQERLEAVKPRLAAMLEGVKSQMVVIPAGKFQMGCSKGDRDCASDESPAHNVSIASFKLGKHEVTFEQYDIFAAATGREEPSDSGWGRGTRPVINVNWEDAQAYVKWFSEQSGQRFRLPTEAEWEYAARAGSKTRYSWGASIGRGKANCDSDCGDSFGNTSPVGSFPVNTFGLFDMHGNVWEWVQDNWHDDYTGAPTDGSVWPGGDPSRRVLRGGSWGGDAGFLRASDRNYGGATYRGSYGGFRVAQDL